MIKYYSNILYGIAMFAILFWFTYSKGWIFANFESISAKKAISFLENDHNISLLDVRTIEEYKEGHLVNATLIPVQALEQNLGIIKTEKQKKIIVYCRTGSRSVSASRILESHGFTPLNVRGGILELKAVGANIIK